MNITQKQKGILFMILSALSFASMQVVVRMSREIPTMEQICVRNLFILIVSFFIIRKKRGSYYGPKKYQPYLFGRSFFGFLGLITLFYASSHAAQGDVTVLNKLTLNATHILTIDPSDILRIQKHTCHTASCSDRRAARQCQRGREVQREGCGKHPGEEFLPSSFHCKSLLFFTNFVAGKKLHGSLLGYRGALVFAINPGLVFG